MNKVQTKLFHRSYKWKKMTIIVVRVLLRGFPWANSDYGKIQRIQKTYPCYTLYTIQAVRTGCKTVHSVCKIIVQEALRKWTGKQEIGHHHYFYVKTKRKEFALVSQSVSYPLF